MVGWCGLGGGLFLAPSFPLLEALLTTAENSQNTHAAIQQVVGPFKDFTAVIGPNGAGYARFFAYIYYIYVCWMCACVCLWLTRGIYFVGVCFVMYGE